MIGDPEKPYQNPAATPSNDMRCRVRLAALLRRNPPNTRKRNPPPTSYVAFRKAGDAIQPR